MKGVISWNHINELNLLKQELQKNSSRITILFRYEVTSSGLHFQNPTHGQGKIIRVREEKVLDVAVDVRKDSPTFGKYVMRELCKDNWHMLWTPEGFSHSFLALEDSVVLYKTTAEYDKDSEGGLIWNDPEVGIKWIKTEKVISEKDKIWPHLKEVNSNPNIAII
ncbi:MAG: dTDP-4-dehydrorhamnose 3,5-epimerase [Thermoplasmatales archaeon]